MTTYTHLTKRENTLYQKIEQKKKTKNWETNNNQTYVMIVISVDLSK